MKREKFLRSLLLLVITIGITNTALGYTPAYTKVDHRGLIEMPGVIKSNDKSWWGAANLVAFGPGWSYSAQDYAAKNGKKEAIVDNDNKVIGVTFSANMNAGSSKINIYQEFRDTSVDGKQQMKVLWRIKSADGKPMKLESAFVVIPFAIYDFSGQKISDALGNTFTFPAEFSSEYLAHNLNQSAISAVGKSIKLDLGIQKGQLAIFDGRGQKNPGYQFRINFPNTKDSTESEVEFVIGGYFAKSQKKGNGKIDFQAPKPPTIMKANNNWVPFNYTIGVKPGTILDLSNTGAQKHIPAGKYGRVIVGPDGRYAFEKNPTLRQRFVGANLCFDANFLTKEEADRVVADFVRMGYNTVRFHHTDVIMMEGQWGHDYWNKKTRGVIDKNQLDKIDYLFAKMKEAGIYVTIDLYQMGAMGMIDGVDKQVHTAIKALVPIHQPAFEVWFKSAMEWLNHVNPYTGIAWKDDPALFTICPINEDAIASVWWEAKDKYNAAFEEWKKTNATEGRNENQLRAQFLTEVKVKSNKQIKQRLEAAGVKTLLSGSNWWDTMAQTFEREALDVVDNHQYCDHYHTTHPTTKMNNRSTFEEGGNSFNYMTPLMKTPTRYFGKPMMITEYNFCAPNEWRLEAGAMVGAYASLQNWDAMYRFAWSHAKKALFEQLPISGFDICRDPVGMLTERQIVLMYGRGDVAAANNKYVYGVTMNEATQQGVGDMWGKGLFPSKFVNLCAMSQIGSQVIEGGQPIKGKFTAVVGKTKPSDEVLAGNKFLPLDEITVTAGKGEVVSDTNEIKINKSKKYIRIDTDKTDCIVARKDAKLSAGALSIADNTCYCSVSASSMDGKSIENSSKLLIFHITDVVNSNMEFNNPSRTEMKKTGTLPYLARVGSVKAKIKSNVPNMKLYALNSAGERIRRVPCKYSEEEGAYMFKLAVSTDEEASMIYELSK